MDFRIEGTAWLGKVEVMQKYMLALGIMVSMALALPACGLLELIPTPIPQHPATPTPKPASLRTETRLPQTRLPEQELPAPPTVETARGEVSAAEGGSVSSPGGDISLVVPPGALKQDTEIEITYYAYAPQSGNPMAGEAVFGPSGLKFQQPAILSIALPEPVDSADDLAVFSLSAQNPAINLGSEISHVQRVMDFSYDADTQTLQVPIQHFSLLGWVHEKKMYLVFDIPGKYLKKGDLIYVLTGREPGAGAFWIPGHSGLYLGTQKPYSDENDGKTIIESTPRDLSRQQPEDGVQFAELRDFKTLFGSHIYMGARRPRFEVTDEQRNRIAAWAVDQLGEDYAKLGGPFLYTGAAPQELFLAHVAGLSCTGLSEGAYEAGTGRQIVSQESRLILWPLRQFIRTVPVREAEVEAGEAFSMFITGVIKLPRAGLGGLLSRVNLYSSDYYDNAEFSTLSMFADSEPVKEVVAAGRAKFIAANGQFLFKPRPEDVGRTYRFTFTVDAGKVGLGQVVETFQVKVKAKADELICREEFYATGELHSERCFLNGKEHGLSKHYFKSGQIRQETHFVDGKEHGLSKGYFESGQIKLEAPFVDGKLDGVRTEYNEAGKVLSQWTYKDYFVPNLFFTGGGQGEKKEGIEYTYYDSGNLRTEKHYFGSTGNLHGPSKEYWEVGLRRQDHYENGKRHGVSKSYARSGAVETEVSWAEGKKDGPSRDYYESGQLKLDRMYSQGQLDGPHKKLNEAGLLLSEITYVQGEKREGVEYSYYETGVKSKESHYVGDMRHGMTTSYYRSGAVSDEGQWVDGEKQGVHKSFFDSGALSSETPYANGKVNGVVKTYYESGAPDIEFSFKDGERHGVFKSFCKDGTRLVEARYENGVQQEKKQYAYSCFEVERARR